MNIIIPLIRNECEGLGFLGFSTQTNFFRKLYRKSSVETSYDSNISSWSVNLWNLTDFHFVTFEIMNVKGVYLKKQYSSLTEGVSSHQYFFIKYWNLESKGFFGL